MFKHLFGSVRRANEAIAVTIYDEIVAAARQPVYFAKLNVPDTPLGRYEMLSLHMFLFLHRMKGEESAAGQLAQSVTDMFFQDLDHSLRELGIGDVGVPKRMKKLTKMFYGRAIAYGEALDNDDIEALAAALARNIMPDLETWPEACELANRVQALMVNLQDQSSDEILAGRLNLLPVSELAQ